MFRIKCSHPAILSRRLLRIIYFILLILLFSLAIPQHVDATPRHLFEANNEAELEADAIWGNFRAIFPFHIQVIGITEPLADGSRVLVISEPPPHTTAEYFQVMAESIGGKARFKSNTIGYDGYAKDVVISMPPQAPEVLATFLETIHRDLFFTTYGASVIRLPLDARNPIDNQLDLSISAADLIRWLDDEKIQFAPWFGGEKQSIYKILANQQTGVFHSNESGLVAWSLPRHQSIDNLASQARIFFLDSDLVIGAVADENQVAILARERAVSQLDLPPLRVEDVQLLASEESSSLAQSYERTHLLAGKLPSNQDWAPIYLSPRLIDSEFGSLLDITDQLLKSWSLNGLVEYINFHYPQPDHWPPFPSSLEDVMAETGSILFNWNTDGMVYATTVGSYEYLALDRTGALPITYQSGDVAVTEHERIAYDYFAELNNADLARVVQYTALFQIFQAFDIFAFQPIATDQSKEGDEILSTEVKDVLQTVIAFSDDQWFQMIDEHLQTSLYGEMSANTSAIIADARTAFRSSAEQEESIAQAQTALADNPELLPIIDGFILEDEVLDVAEELKQHLNTGLTLWGADAVTELVDVIAVRPAYAPNVSQDFSPDLFQHFRMSEHKKIETLSATQQHDLLVSWALDTANLITAPYVKEALTASLVDMPAISERYVYALNAPTPSWIKTPSIVLSQHKTDKSATGGHNLDAQVVLFRESNEVEPGEIETVIEDGKRVILYHPDDRSFVFEFWREIVAGEDATLDFRELTFTTPQAPRDALHLSDIPSATTVVDAPEAETIKSIGIQRQSGVKSESDGDARKDGEAFEHTTYIVSRTDNGFKIEQIIEGEQNPTSLVFMAPSLVDVNEYFEQVIIATGSTTRNEIQFMFKKLSPKEIENLSHSLNFRVSIREGQTPIDVEAALQSPVDWSKAEIRFTEPVIERNGLYAGYQKTTLEITVPPIQPQKPSLFMRIHLYFKGVMPDGLTSRIERIIRTIFNRSQEKSVRTVIRELEKELSQTNFGADVDIRVDFIDLIIAQIKAYSERS